MSHESSNVPDDSEAVLEALVSQLPAHGTVVSGAAGFLGSHFLLWRSMASGHHVALARSRGGVSAARRIHRAVEVARGSYPGLRARAGRGAFITLDADMTTPFCGLDADALRSAQVREFWHFAANLGFEDRKADAIRATNVDGTLNAIELAATLGVERFFYVSTAYACGRQQGSIDEALHPIGSFNNAYEESKCFAEHEVVQRCAQLGLRAVILRPSVVAGPRASKMSGGSNTGIYGFLYTLWRLKPVLMKVTGHVSLGFDPETTLNVIPVDDMLARFIEISQSSDAKAVYHVVSEREVSTSDIVAAAAAAVQLDNLEPGGVANDATFNKAAKRAMGFFRHYLTGHRRFLTDAPASPGLSRTHLFSYMNEFAKEFQVNEASSLLKKSIVVSADGTRIRAYEAATKATETLVIINGYAMPVDFLTPLIERLAHSWRVVTWESRDVPLENASFLEEHSGVEGQIEDLKAVLDHYGVERAHVLGWCSGAQVGLEAAAKLGPRVQSLTTLSASFGFPFSKKTEFESRLLALLPQVSGDREKAALFSQMLFGEAGMQNTESGGGALASLAGISDPRIAEMATVPFRSGEGLYRYAHFVQRLYSRPDLHDWSSIRVPISLVVNQHNPVAHPDSSRDVAQRMPNARVVQIEGNDHFNVFHQPEVLADTLQRLVNSSSTHTGSGDVVV